MTMKPRVDNPLGGASVGHNSANVTRALHGIRFPANREDMLTQAKHNHASREALEDIQKLADHDYLDIEEVIRDYGKRR